MKITKKHFKLMSKQTQLEIITSIPDGVVNDSMLYCISVLINTHFDVLSSKLKLVDYINQLTFDNYVCSQLIKQMDETVIDKLICYIDDELITSLYAIVQIYARKFSISRNFQYYDLIRKYVVLHHADNPSMFANDDIPRFRSIVLSKTKHVSIRNTMYQNDLIKRDILIKFAKMFNLIYYTDGFKIFLYNRDLTNEQFINICNKIT